MWEESRNMLHSFDLNMLDRVYPDNCPDCGAQDKHVFFYKFDEADKDGGVWMWCSKCHSYTHARAVIPPMWRNPDFIDEDKLDSSMDYLEANKARIDSWISDFKKSDDA